MGNTGIIQKFFLFLRHAGIGAGRIEHENRILLIHPYRWKNFCSMGALRVVGVAKVSTGCALAGDVMQQGECSEGGKFLKCVEPWVSG